jgi:uncharacterized damage-inducible protein DinB
MEDRTMGSLPGFAGEIGRWMWCLEDTRRRTLDNISGISHSELDWQPDPGANTIGSLLYHLAAIEMSYLFEDLLAGAEFPSDLDILLPYNVRQIDGSLVGVKGEALTDYLNRLGMCRNLLVQFFQRMEADQFHNPVQLEEYSISPSWVLHHLMQHEGEHRGQIEEIRRLYQRSLG